MNQEYVHTLNILYSKKWIIYILLPTLQAPCFGLVPFENIDLAFEANSAISLTCYIVLWFVFDVIDRIQTWCWAEMQCEVNASR